MLLRGFYDKCHVLKEERNEKIDQKFLKNASIIKGE
jgi:hypothetical protein